MIHRQHLNQHAAEFDDEAGTLAIYGSGQRLALPAEEAADMLIFLYGQRGRLLALLQQSNPLQVGQLPALPNSAAERLAAVDEQREYSRLESARQHVLEGSPTTLTLSEWLAIIAEWRGLCALCQIAPFSELAIWIPARGLVAGNVAPLCKICAHHKAHSFLSAMERVELALDNAPVSYTRF